MATVDKLIIEIDGNAAQAKSGIDSMVKSLESLRSAASNQRSLNAVSAGIKAIRDSAAILDSESISKLNMMSDALTKMGVLDKIKLSTSWASQIKGIGDATWSLQGVDWSPLAELSDKLSPLGNIQKANNLNNVVNTLRKMPDAMKAVADIDSTQLQKFADSVEQIRKAIQPLADEMRAVKEGFSSLPANIRKAIKANEKLTKSAEESKKTFGDYLKRILKFSALAYGFSKIKDAAMDAFEASNDYIEALNLADVAMGSGAQKAVEYAQKVESVAGINMTEWLSELSTFNQQLQTFGIPNKTANNMSQQLTQLGYDMQSVFNIKDVDTVMKRIQSGISGEVEGMRRYGVELSKAAMEEYALSKGITAKWSSMSIAQKVALRYNKIMEQTSNIQGDLARTIITPANSLRIFYNQCAIATRYIGQIVSVIAAKLIPIFQAVVVVIGRAAQAIASIFGFSLPSIGGMETDLKGAVGGASDLEQALGGAGSAAKDAAKEVKGLLAGWDEINIIQQESDKSGSGGGGGGAGGGALGDLWGLGDYSYDFLKGIKEQVNDIIEKIESFKPEILGLLGAISAFAIGNKIAKIAEYLGASKDALAAIHQLTAGVALTIVGISLTWDAVNGIVNGEGWTWENMLKAVAGAFLEIPGLSMIGSSAAKLMGLENISSLGFGIGAYIAITSATVAFALAKKMGKNGITKEDVIGAVISTINAGVGAGFATAAMGASWPIVLTVGSIVAISVGIATLHFYARKKTENMVAEALKEAGNGDFSMDSVINAVQKEFSSRLAEAQVTFGIYADFTKTKEDLQTATESVKNLNSTVFGSDAPTPEDIKALKDAWSDFDTALKGTTDNAFALSFEGINTMIDSEIETLQEKGKEFQKQYMIMQQGMTEYQAETAQKRNEIINKIAKGSATNEEMDWYNQHAQSALNVREERRWSELMENPFTVDFNSEDGLTSAKEYVDKINSMSAEVKEAYQTAYKEQIEGQEYLKDLAYERYNNGDWTKAEYDSTISVIDGAIAGIKQAYDAKVGSLSSETSTLMTNLFTQFLSPDALNKFIPDSPWTANDSNRRMQEYVSNTISPFIQSIEDAGSVSDADLQKFKLVEQLMKGAITTTDQGVLYGQASYGISLQRAINAALGGAFTLEELTDTSFGTDMDAIAKRIQEFEDSFVGEDANLTLPAVDTATEFDPSLEETKSYVETTWNPDMTEATKITAASPDMSNITNAMNSTLSMGRQWNTTMTNLLNLSGTSRRGGKIGISMTALKYADGGFPSEGSLFIANEQGPELVGQIGSQSAVANNGQIVDGIARGVADANREQNTYYQRMISLLEQLNRKENNVVVKPSPELGKTVSRSVKMYESVRGY